MKFLLLFLVLCSVKSQAFDHKTCVLKKIESYLNSTNSCVRSNLEAISPKVRLAYLACDREMVLKSTASDVQEMFAKKTKGNYDDEIEIKINDKILKCGYRGAVRIQNKGMSTADIENSPIEIKLKKSIVPKEPAQ